MSGKSVNAFYPVRGPVHGGRTGEAMGGLEEVFGAKMREFTTVGIGGPAERMVFPHSSREVQAVLAALRAKGAPHLPLGAGSNLLVSDEGVPGTVICLKRNMGKVLFADGGSVVADAGTMLPRFAVLCALSGLSGVEELAGIPGTVGGALTMNAGAFGRSIADVLEWLEIAPAEGGLGRVAAGEARFSYREARFPASGVIVRAGFHLAPVSTDRVFSRMKELNAKRRAHQPWGERTFGSMFRNPQGAESAGLLLERAGMKGAGEGDLRVSEKHANFLINRGRGTARDAAALMDRCREAVRALSGITLVPEVRTWGAVHG